MGQNVSSCFARAYRLVFVKMTITLRWHFCVRFLLSRARSIYSEILFKSPKPLMAVKMFALLWAVEHISLRICVAVLPRTSLASDKAIPKRSDMWQAWQIVCWVFPRISVIYYWIHLMWRQYSIVNPFMIGTMIQREIPWWVGHREYSYFLNMFILIYLLLYYV